MKRRQAARAGAGGLMHLLERPYPAERPEHRAGPQPGRRGWSPTAVGLFLVAGSMLLSTALLLSAGVVAWRWADAHVPHLGLTSRQNETVNRTELVREIQAFQLVTVKQTYATHTEQTLSQAFSVGTSQVAVPDWLAGEHMRVEGQTDVLAGVDLAKVGPEDIVVTGNGKDRSVQVNIPAAQVLSTELVPNTLNVSVTAGVLPRVEQAFGVSDDQFRNSSADLLLQAGRQTAEQQGLEADATVAAQRRLTGFLQQLPSDGGRVVYKVAVKPSSG